MAVVQAGTPTSAEVEFEARVGGFLSFVEPPGDALASRYLDRECGIGSGPAMPGEAPVIRIVVADNDPDALDLVLTDLRLEGHEVFGAADAAGAAELVDSVSPQVVVLDYRMPPGDDGLTLAERLVKEHAGLRVLIYSNYQSAELRTRAAALGVPFLSKGNLRVLRSAVTAP